MLSALLIPCKGNPPVIIRYPSQIANNTKIFCFLFIINLNKLLKNYRVVDAHVMTL